MQINLGLRLPRVVRLAALWLTSPLNRQRIRGARVQVCVFAIAHHPEPSILMVRSVYGDWMPPQEGVMLDESVESAAWRCLEEEVGISVDDPGRRRNLAAFRNKHFLKRLSLPEDRRGERPIADNVDEGPLSLIQMKSKAYWAAILVFGSQYEVGAAANHREVSAAEWCTLDEARKRIAGSVREEKAAILRDGLELAERALPEGAPPIEWTPQDFIVGGRYCDSQPLVSELEGLRRARSSDALVLFAFRESTVFRPLLRLVHKDQQRLTELRQILVSEAKLTSIARDNPTTEDLKASLTTALPIDELGLGDLELTLLERVEQETPRPADDPRAPLTRPASIVVLAFGGRPAKDEQGALDALLLMVNASAPVIAHRELEGQTDLRDALAQTERTWNERRSALPSDEGLSDLASIAVGEDSDWHPDDYATMLLDLALQVTRSSVGNLYVAKRDGRTLKRVAHRLNADEFEELQPATENEPRSVVMRAYERGRALIINDVVDYQRMNPQAGYLSVLDGTELEPYAELAVPIEQGPFSSLVPPTSPAHSQPPRTKPIGVINVERVRPDDAAAGDFTPSDLAALQTIAFFYALRRAGSLTMASASSLARLTQRNALAPAGAALELPAGTHVADVPADLFSARESLALIADQIHALTRSTSVTIRVVTANQMGLVRLVASPRERTEDEYTVIPIADRESVNAWVARNGLPCYIPNVLDRGGTHFDGLDGIITVPDREQVRSELCLPIAVQGRVLGTLNLESSQHSDYPDDVTAVVSALAQQAGVAIAQARRVDEQRLFAIHAEQTRRSHLILKKVGKFNKWLQAHDHQVVGDQGADLRRMAEEIGAAADPLRPAAAITAALSGARRPAREAVEESLQRSRVADHVRVRSLPPRELVLHELAAHVLTIALTELLQNAANYVSLHTKLSFTVRLRYRAVRRGLRNYLCLEVTNRVEDELPPEIVSLLYRRPVSRERTHLGAYVAGAYVRSVGGEIYIAENSGNYLTVALELPLVPESDDVN